MPDYAGPTSRAFLDSLPAETTAEKMARENERTIAAAICEIEESAKRQRIDLTPKATAGDRATLFGVASLLKLANECGAKPSSGERDAYNLGTAAGIRIALKTLGYAK